MSLEFTRALGPRHWFIGAAGVLLLLMLIGGSWISIILIFAIGIAAYFGLKNLKSIFAFKAYNGVWRYGAIVGAGLLVAMIAAWSLLGWTTILFVLGTIAISLASYAIVLSLQRMSIPNSVINVTTDVKLRAPRFRNWGRYVLKAELTTEMLTAKGKTRRLHTKRMHVKVHKEDFPEGRLVEACHEFVQNFVEKERQFLAKSYPDTPLMIDHGYFKQVRNLALPATTIIIPPVSEKVVNSEVKQQN